MSGHKRVPWLALLWTTASRRANDAASSFWHPDRADVVRR